MNSSSENMMKKIEVLEERLHEILAFPKFEQLNAAISENAKLISEMKQLESKRPKLEPNSIGKHVQVLEERLNDILAEQRFSNLNAVMSENEKLKYQKGQLEKAIARAEDCLNRYQVCVIGALSAIFDFAIKQAFPILKKVNAVISLSSNPTFGDYQCNNALALSKELATMDIKLAPKEISDKICQFIVKGSLIEKFDVAGPGFINIFINRSFVENEVSKIVRFGFTMAPPRRALKVIVDMSSPNIAKEMHVGHLRSTIIGESVSRLLAFLGHHILKLNHLGDWGTQFGMLIAHLTDIYKDLGDQPLPVSDLQSFYKASKERFDEDEDFRKRAYESVVKLQAFDPEHIKNWNKICDVSMKEFNSIYKRMDIEDLIPRGESFYQSRMVDLVNYLEERSMLESDDGRKILWTDGSNIPLIIVKSDGGYTYDTSDLAAIRQRIQEEGGERIIYVVDMGQGTHLETVFQAAQKCSFLEPRRHKAEHVGFGVVLGEDKKKFKTRSGDTVKLVDLLNEGVERSLAKLKEKGRDKELSQEEQMIAAEAVAYGCIKYADLSHNRINDYIFSFDKMLDDRGNTAAYLLYSYTRIRSIIRKTGWSAEKLAQLCNSARIVLEHPSELKLGKTICKLPDVIAKLETELLFHKLCDFVYELSTTFTEFYDACYCIQQDRKTGEVININESRILLCEATSTTMKCCFDILGIRTVEKM